MKKAVGAAAVVLVTLAACTQPSTPSDEPVTIGLTYVPNIQFAPYYVALEKGYFEDAGVDVTLRHHGQDEDLFGALTQEVEDVVVAGGAEMIQAHEQGVDAMTFQTLYETYPVTVIVAKDSTIETLSDLKGKTLGVPGRFGETWFGALAFLEQANLEEQDLTIKEIGFTQQAALSGNHVDAVVGFANNDIPQFAATGLEVRSLPHDPIPVVGVGIGAGSETITENPEVMEAIATATKRAIQDIVEDPQTAVDAAEEHIPGTIAPDQKEVMVEVVERTNDLYGDPHSSAWGIPDVEVWEEMNSFMAEANLITEPVSLSDVVTNEVNGKE